MQIEAIQTFLAIVKTGRFHAAARQLGVTQTTVSARIRSLEEAVNNRLFERGVGGTRLSAFGQEFQPLAEEIDSLWIIASNKLSKDLSSRTSLRVGAQLSIWDPLLVDLTIHLERSYGKMVFALNFDHTLDVREAVLKHMLDIALTHQPSDEGHLNYRPLSPEPLVYIEADHALANPRPPFISLELGKTYQTYVDGLIDREDRKSLFLGNCLMGLRYLLKQGGRGLFPTSLVQNHIDDGTVRLVPGSELFHLPCYLVHRLDTPSENQVAEIIACLKEIRLS